MIAASVATSRRKDSRSGPELAAAAVMTSSQRAPCCCQISSFGPSTARYTGIRKPTVLCSAWPGWRSNSGSAASTRSCSAASAADGPGPGRKSNR